MKPIKRLSIYRTLSVCVSVLTCTTAVAGPVYQPSGMNLTYGNVAHGQSLYSAANNPAAAAADLARGEGGALRAMAIGGAAGIEYGNVQDLFDFYDRVSAPYEPSDPGDGSPGNLPESGIDLGFILDNLDPQYAEALNAIATEVARQAALLAVIAVEGYGKAWYSGDVPVVLGKKYLGGAWTFGLNWTGSSKAFGVTSPLDFDRDAALEAISDWMALDPADRPTRLPISDDLILKPDLLTNAVRLGIVSDSSLVVKSTRTMELNLGYGWQAWSGQTSSLFLGATVRGYSMQLSRVSVRFGDLTDSEELFNSIRNADYRTDQRLSVDFGGLWVGKNYQFGAQCTNLNEPDFLFPELELESYRNKDIIDRLIQDRKYTMDRQLKLEASVFSEDRHLSANLGYDANPVTDPLGDEYQWVTLSAGITTGRWWLPAARIGYRQNLAGTEISYLSLGVTAFKFVDIDISSALDTVSVSGTKLPRGLMGSIGFQINFN